MLGKEKISWEKYSQEARRIIHRYIADYNIDITITKTSLCKLTIKKNTEKIIIPI